MGGSSQSLTVEMFNSIYVEYWALEYPIARDVLARNTGCPVIPVRHYKDVFNRTNQDYALQKKYPSLILAVKESPFLYKGPEVCQNFGCPNFRYASLLLNCMFDCEYCYLRGMYPSAYPVAFVNTEDFIDAIGRAASEAPLYLAASYDTDLVAFDPVIPYTVYLHGLLIAHHGLTVEIRTKSANRSFYEAYAPLPNLVIAFSLAPEAVIRKYEKRAPTLEARLGAIRAAADKGFGIRLCFNPVFIGDDMDELYEPFFRQVFSSIDPGVVSDVGYGFFRMPRDFFRRIGAASRSDLYMDRYETENNVVSYPASLRDNVMARHMDVLTRYMPKERIYTPESGGFT